MKQATGKHFTEFSTSVKSLLGQKLSEHPTIRDYVNTLDNTSQMKQSFKDISNSVEGA